MLIKVKIKRKILLRFFWTGHLCYFVGWASAGMSERMKRGTNVMSEGMTALAWFFI